MGRFTSTGFSVRVHGPTRRDQSLIGYLFTGSHDGASQGVVEASGPSLSHRLPTLVVWLSFGLRGPGVAG